MKAVREEEVKLHTAEKNIFMYENPNVALVTITVDVVRTDSLIKRNKMFF